MARGRWFVCVLVIGCLVASAAAASKTGQFWAGLRDQSYLPEERLHPDSGGDGDRDGSWFYYPNDQYNNGTPGGVQPAQQPVPGWWNEWWYDDPYDPTRYKKVTMDFDYWLMNPQDPLGGQLDVWINWSKPGWQTGPAGHAPTPADETFTGQFIGRQLIDTIPVNNAAPVHSHKEYDLRDFGIRYNPEWISVDIMGFNVWMSAPPPPWPQWPGGNPPGVGPGTIEHECLGAEIPEPMTMLAVGLGVASLAGYVRRRRRTA